MPYLKFLHSVCVSVNVESCVITLVYGKCDGVRAYAVADGGELRSDASELVYDGGIRFQA